MLLELMMLQNFEVRLWYRCEIDGGRSWEVKENFEAANKICNERGGCKEGGGRQYI